jgi:quinol monooxygenase YgiN
MYGLVVRFEVRPDCIEAFDELVSETLVGIRDLEAGTMMYFNSSVADSTSSRIFVEIYADEAAFRRHEEYSHTRRFLADRDALITSYRVEFLQPIDGKYPNW